MLSRSRVKVAAACLLLGVALLATAADAPRIGDRVQVKRGTAWVDATITDVEGSRVRAKVGPGVESWFGAGDYRPALGAAAGAATTKPGPATTVSAGASSKAPAKPQPIVVGQTVLYQFIYWNKAKVTGRDGARVKIKPEGTWPEKWVAEKDLLPYRLGDAAFFASVAPGDWVLFDDTGGFTKAIVVERDAKRVRLHWPSKPTSQDKWVEVEKTRPLLAGIPEDAKAVAASAIAATLPAEERLKADRADRAAKDAKAKADAAAELATIRAEWGSAGAPGSGREVKPDPKAPWTMQVDAGLDPDLNPLPAPVRLEGPNDDRSIRGTPRFVPLNTQPPAGMVILSQDVFEGGGNRDRLIRVDLTSGQMSAAVVMPARIQALRVSPDGKLVLAMGVVPDVGRYLTVYAITASGLDPVARWRVKDEKALKWTAFAGNGRVLALSDAGDLTAWELPAMAGASAPGGRVAAPKALYTLRLGTHFWNPPVLSPGGRYMGLAAEGRAMFLDTATGATAGSVPEFNWATGHIAFRPDGAQVALSERERLKVCDAASGRVARSVPIPEEFVPGIPSIQWLSNTQVLLVQSHSVLVDLELRRVTWGYNLPSRATEAPVLGGVKYFFYDNWPDTQVRLTSAKLLDVVPFRSGQGEKPIEQLMVFAPGTKVAVVLATDAPEPKRAAIAKSLEEQVTRMGMVVDPAAPLKVTARSENGAPIQKQYGVPGFAPQQVTVTPKVLTVAVERDGKELWKSQMTASGSSLMLVKKGQPIEDVIRAEQEESYLWLARVQLPRDLIPPKAYALRGWLNVDDKGAPARRK